MWIVIQCNTDCPLGGKKQKFGVGQGIVDNRIPALASYSNFESQYIKNYLIREQNTNYKNVL